LALPASGWLKIQCIPSRLPRVQRVVALSSANRQQADKQTELPLKVVIQVRQSKVQITVPMAVATLSLIC